MRRGVSSNVYDMAILYGTSSKYMCGNPMRGAVWVLEVITVRPAHLEAHSSKKTISQYPFDKLPIWNSTDGTTE